MKKKIFIITTIILVATLVHSQTTLYVAASKTPCKGGPGDMCLQVKKSIDAPFNPFYSTIDGFTHEAGFEYIIKVKIELDSKTNAQRYSLLEIISKTKAIQGFDTRLISNWKLYKIQKSGALFKVSNHVGNIQFTSDGGVNGKNTCNSFFGKCKANNGQIQFSDMGATKMYCENSMESEFMNALQQATSYKITKKYLYIMQGTTILMILAKNGR